MSDERAEYLLHHMNTFVEELKEIMSDEMAEDIIYCTTVFVMKPRYETQSGGEPEGEGLVEDMNKYENDTDFLRDSEEKREALVLLSRYFLHGESMKVAGETFSKVYMEFEEVWKKCTLSIDPSEIRD
ncbi:hypothetical protein M231_05818 [Tremella mesenterica]|uniref:Uncharacterized protein n=1 Tax=Tremella mesenterica TaxID=5217 RepID=A0A4Q1BH51_TREME|nr:hypothetical protein M231_05818 [Tremella mesenterica]